MAVGWLSAGWWWSTSPSTLRTWRRWRASSGSTWTWWRSGSRRGDGGRRDVLDRPTDPVTGGRPRGPNTTAGWGWRRPGGTKYNQTGRRRAAAAPGLPEQLHLKRLYQVTHRASLKTAAASSHCVQFNRNTSKLLETVLVGAKSVDNVEEMVG